MANELITGWFTLGGAAVGAVATSVVTSITAWGQQRAASRARIAAREDVFRADAGAYVSAVDIYMGWAIDLHQKLLVPAGQRELDHVRPISMHGPRWGRPWARCRYQRRKAWGKKR